MSEPTTPTDNQSSALTPLSRTSRATGQSRLEALFGPIVLTPSTKGDSFYNHTHVNCAASGSTQTQNPQGDEQRQQ